MKTALITGITGQDGAYLAELLLNKGYLFTVPIAAPAPSISGVSANSTWTSTLIFT